MTGTNKYIEEIDNKHIVKGAHVAHVKPDIKTAKMLVYSSN